MKLIEGKGVSKFFGGIKALDHVDFHLDEGEIVGLIGPNGSGKTTLFNVISGHLTLTSGKIIFNGKDVSGFKPYQTCRLGIARTFQIPKPFHKMTVRENILVPMTFARTRDKNVNVEHEINQLLEKLGLIDKILTFASDLTLYEQRVLELARSLACKPRLLLLDEVMAGLNPSETEKILKILKELHEEFGITLFVIEHNLRAITGLVKRVIVLNQGIKMAEGEPKKVFRDKKVIEAYLGEEYA
ncbi:MAG: ABC transporter ATP-binding protein [Candidatus Bathyarchaeia archaeon]